MHYRYQSGEQIYEIDIERKGEHYQATIAGEVYAFELLDQQPGELSLRFNGKPVTLYWAVDGSQKWISQSGCTYRLEPPAPRSARGAGGGAEGGAVRAPMPAQVRAVQVQPGDLVEKGQTLLLLEAMKMEIHVRAPEAGRVARLLVKPEQAVDKDQVLVELTPAQAGETP